MSAVPLIEHYKWSGGHEAMLRFGSTTGPVVIAALPLFEEANRTRAFLVATLRALGALGIGAVLPDLPGQGESAMPTDQATLAAMRSAFAAAARKVASGERPVHGLALRSGALIDGDAALRSRWRLSPVTGPELLGALVRLRRLTGERGEWPSDGRAVEVAGNLVSPTLSAELAAAGDVTVTPLRVVRLAGDPRAANHILAGSPLWRRSEPGVDPVLSQALAADIAAWIA